MRAVFLLPRLGLALVAVLLLAGPVAAQPDPLIEAVLDSVNAENLIRGIRDMEDYGTRFAGSANAPLVAQDLLARMEAFGWQPWLEEFTFDPDTLGLPPITSWNVVARRDGIAPYPEGATVIIGAHWDSIDGEPGGSWADPENPSPGANDNGSGVSAVLEIARILGTREFGQNVEIVFFGAEETHLQGSKHHVEQLQAEGVNVAGYFNVDSIGFDEDEFDMVVYHDNQSAWFKDVTMNLIQTYSAIVPEAIFATGGGSNSDAHWFWQYSDPAVSLWEGLDHAPYYNHRLDTYENCITLNGFHKQMTQLALSCFSAYAVLLEETAAGDFPASGPAALAVYPNPFAERTTLRLAGAADGAREIHIFDPRGRRVRALAMAGSRAITWDGRDERGARLAAGIYLARVGGTPDAEAKRIVLLR